MPNKYDLKMFFKMKTSSLSLARPFFLLRQIMFTWLKRFYFIRNLKHIFKDNIEC